MAKPEDTPSAILEALSMALGGIGLSPRVHERASAVLATLGFALFSRAESGHLRLASHPPDWVGQLWPPVVAPGDWLPLSIVSPFFENFLVDAAACWAENGDRQAHSGPWVERLPNGEELQLEATAFLHSGQPVIVIERLGAAFETRKELLQKGRETAIAYQRLNSEIQKKEILLHCLSYEMSAALGNVITSLRLLEIEQDPGKMRRLVELASQASQEQQRLIHRVLDVFAAELEGLYGRAGRPHIGADVTAAVRRAIETVSPAFAGRNVRLNALPAVGELKIVDDAGHLERVLVNLLEHALDYSPAGSHVAVRVEGEPESVVIRVEDDGQEIAPEISRNLFSRFDSVGHVPTTTLRLDFCRIAVENCHGEIGHAPRGGGGNCFWIRWPKAAVAAP